MRCPSTNRIGIVALTAVLLIVIDDALPAADIHHRASVTAASELTFSVSRLTSTTMRS